MAGQETKGLQALSLSTPPHMQKSLGMGIVFLTWG